MCRVSKCSVLKSVHTTFNFPYSFILEPHISEKIKIFFDRQTQWIIVTWKGKHVFFSFGVFCRELNKYVEEWAFVQFVRDFTYMPIQYEVEI